MILPGKLLLREGEVNVILLLGPIFSSPPLAKLVKRTGLKGIPDTFPLENHRKQLPGDGWVLGQGKREKRELWSKIYVLGENAGFSQAVRRYREAPKPKKPVIEEVVIHCSYSCKKEASFLFSHQKKKRGKCVTEKISYVVGKSRP